MRVKVNLYPPDGWFFVERDGVKLKAGSFRGVLKKIKHYRKLNSFPPGNPEEELATQVCQRVPMMCFDDSNSWAHPKPPTTSLKSRVLKWLSDLTQVTPVFVSPPEVQKRAEICLRCPKMGPMEKGCSTCRDAIREMQTVIARGRKLDGRLMCCSILGTDLKVATLIADSRLNDPSLPDGCWRKVK